MAKQDDQNYDGRKKRFMSTFLKTFLISTALLSVIALGLFYCYLKISGPSASAPGAAEIAEGLKQRKNAIAEIFESVPERVNFVILGVDRGDDRTDMVMVGSFVPKDGSLFLVSVPRDTLVTIPPQRLETVKEYSPYVPSDGIVKLCEVQHYAGPENGAEYVVIQLEELLGVDFEYYVKINLDGFAFLVDSIGGVEYDVPERMYHNDPYQNLLIDLQPGVQILDGKDAERLVRYRGYSNNDYGRMATQQNFVKEMLKQMVAKENIMKSLPALITAVMEYTETNFKASDVPKYLKYINNFSADNIYTYSLPSSLYKLRGKDFQMLDEEETRVIVEEAFFDASALAERDADSRNKTIQVQNGGFIKGLAGKTKDRLNAEGFNVVDVTDFNGEKSEQTRIIVKRSGQGEDLVPHFSDAAVEVNAEFSKKYDIVVILGTSEE